MVSLARLVDDTKIFLPNDERTVFEIKFDLKPVAANLPAECVKN